MQEDRRKLRAQCKHNLRGARRCQLFVVVVEGIKSWHQ